MALAITVAGGALASTSARAADRIIEFQHPMPPEVRDIAKTYLSKLGYFDATSKNPDASASLLSNDVYWAEADIDDSGYDEIFLSIRGDWCGTAGCDLVILEKTLQGFWRALCQTESDKDHVVLLDKKDDEYRELILSARPSMKPVYLRWANNKCFEHVPGR
jgi:hypothetical protein